MCFKWLAIDLLLSLLNVAYLLNQVSAGLNSVYHAVAEVRPFVTYLACTASASAGSKWTELEFDDSTWPLRHSVTVSNSVKDVDALRFLLESQWLEANKGSRLYCRLYRKSFRSIQSAAVADFRWDLAKRYGTHTPKSFVVSVGAILLIDKQT